MTCFSRVAGFVVGTVAGLAIGEAAFAAEQAAGGAGAAPSVQQMFNAAAAAEAGGRPDEAIAGYEAIERRLSPASRKSLAITRARKGLLLLERGRWEQALTALRYAWAELSKSDASLREDRYYVARSLGQISEARIDYASARDEFAAAEAEAWDARTRRTAIAAQARVRMFDDGRAALALADRALAEAIADKSITKEEVGAYRTLRGRVLLNLQDYAGARAELTKALGDLGGLTERVTISDVVGRSDLSIAALLAKDGEAARRYLAYSGVGGSREALATALSITPPSCGEDGLRPDDVAVIQFSIRDNGATDAIAPIYASRGPAALPLARAVADWAWTPEAVAKVKPFFRQAVRVELRCSVAEAKPDAWALIDDALHGWFREKGWAEPPEAGASPPRALEAARIELARREAADGASSPTLLPVLAAIVRNPSSQGEEVDQVGARMLAMARKAGAPPSALLWFSWGVSDDPPEGGGKKLSSREAWTERHRRLGADPVIAADAVSRSVLRLSEADALLTRRRQAEAAPLLQQVADDAGLDAHHPLKVGALLRLANIRAKTGDLAGARAIYDRTGLTAQSCALVDVQPVRTSGNVGFSRFPLEAARWGFDGWTQLELDVQADGRPANVRAVVSYPPFVFTEASTSILGDARYTQSYRPDGGLGCGGQVQRVRFSRPNG